MNKKKLSIIGFAFVLGGLCACQHSGNRPSEPTEIPAEKGFTEGLVKADTLAATKLVDDYMKLLQNKQFSEAAAMLYKPAPENIWDEPMQLDNEEMAQVINLQKHLSIAAYKITKIEFKTAVDSEIKCAYRTENSTDMSHSITFRLMNYLGGWRLCLMDK